MTRLQGRRQLNLRVRQCCRDGSLVGIAAKGRRDRLRGNKGSPVDPAADDDLDNVAQRLHEGDEQLIARLRDVVGS